MRRSLGRLIAAGLAIVLGTGFVAATFMGMSVLMESSRAGFEDRYAAADLVVTTTGHGSEPTWELVDQLREIPEVDSVYPRNAESAAVVVGDRSRYFSAWAIPEDPTLFPEKMAEGRLPEQSGEVTLTAEVGERLELSIGDSVSIPYNVWDADELVSEESLALTVVGFTASPEGMLMFETHHGALHPDDVALLGSWRGGIDMAPFADIALTVSDGVSMADARAAISQSLPAGLVVATPEYLADQEVEDMLPGTLSIGGIVMIFALLALAVAAMVIGNTFQVLVAQRAHTLAMLRCIGASSRQVKRMVRQEAVIIGAVAGTAGTLGAWLLLQIATVVVNQLYPAMNLPTFVPVSWLAIVVPLVAGVFVSFAASRNASDAATRVDALVALQPIPPITVEGKRGKARLVFVGVLAVLGAIGVGASLAQANSGVTTSSILIGVLGGIAWFTAALAALPLWLPRALKLISKPVAALGSMPRLAMANTNRNPRRTSATSAALLIGVTLVTTVSVGASTAQTSLSHTLDERYNYDLQIDTYGTSTTPVVQLIEGNEHVAAHTTFHNIGITLVTTSDGRNVVSGETADENDHARLDPVSVDSTDGESLSSVLRSAPDHPLEQGTILLGSDLFTTTSDRTPWGTPTILSPGDEVQIHVWPDEGHLPFAELPSLTLTAQPLDASGSYYDPALIDNADAERLLNTDITSVTAQSGGKIWLKIDDLDNAKAMMDDLNDELETLQAWTYGPVQERMTIQTVIDVALTVVYALLAIAVLIAIVGVTNTLSLSVLERRRESATLRVVGLSKKQLRRSLAIEGLYISLAGAALGMLVGCFFGWLGIRMLMGGDTVLDLPWGTLGIILGGAVAAGLLASWVPARMAAKTTPVEALANE